jgi:hypothetical protein
MTSQPASASTIWLDNHCSGTTESASVLAIQRRSAGVRVPSNNRRTPSARAMPTDPAFVVITCTPSRRDANSAVESVHESATTIT